MHIMNAHQIRAAGGFRDANDRARRSDAGIGLTGAAPKSRVRAMRDLPVVAVAAAVERAAAVNLRPRRR